MTRLGVFHICIVMVTIIVTCYAREITKECKRINQCQCEIEGEGIIDLAPLDSGTKDHAFFQDVEAINTTDRYSWNPCTPFCEVHCEGAATCQNASKTRELYYTCGMHDTTQFLNGYVYEGNWNISIDGLVVVYNWTQFRNERVSIIKLNCDEDVDHDFQAYGEYFGHGTLHYFFNLTSKHACPTKSNITGDIPSNITNPSYCPKPWLNETTTTTSTTEITSSSSTSTTMTTTTTQPPFFPFSFLTGLNLALVIITGLAVIFIFYCIIGLTVNLLRGRRGSRVVPNYRFWQCLFLRLTCYCCRCKPEADTNPLIHD